ncbi:MAG: hypothetical protein GY928_00530 [Colwellia sp.]|nr:hypothetical protein [Colwellia sp.]
MPDKQYLSLIAEVLIKKYGEDKIVKLLTDEMTVELNKSKEKMPAYIRDLAGPENKTPFTDYDGGEIDPDTILHALDDAANEMSYSNWHTDKLHRAAESVIRYCEDHKIQVNFSRREA